MLPTQEDLDSYLTSLDELVHSLTPELPNLNEAIHRLWDDIARFGPNLPDIHLPGIEVHVPPPPPPPPPPPVVQGWIEKHQTVVGAVAIGAGLLVGYGAYRLIRVRRARRGGHVLGRGATGTTQRKVVLVLGADSHPLGPSLCSLLSHTSIVIASVSSPSSALSLESLPSSSPGFIRALIFTPSEPRTLPPFLRSLHATLSRRFPLNSPGSPHASPPYPQVHSVISLLSLTLPPDPCPLEHLPLESTYLAYLTQAHIAPLALVQALLPLLRSGGGGGGKEEEKRIHVCTPSIPSRVSLPFSSPQSMASSSTLSALASLRLELKLTNQAIKIVSVDIGSLATGEHDIADKDGNAEADAHASKALALMSPWTSTEKYIYGPSFARALHSSPSHRRPSSLEDAAKALADALILPENEGKGLKETVKNLGKRIGWRMRVWWRGERFGVGAGGTPLPLCILLQTAHNHNLTNVNHSITSLDILPNILPPQPPPERSRATSLCASVSPLSVTHILFSTSMPCCTRTTANHLSRTSSATRCSIEGLAS